MMTPSLFDVPSAFAVGQTVQACAVIGGETVRVEVRILAVNDLGILVENPYSEIQEWFEPDGTWKSTVSQGTAWLEAMA